MRLIDADVMREEWLERGENEYVYDANAFLDSIDEQPTIEAVPVKEINRIIDKFADKLKKKYPIMENDLFTVNDKLHDEIDKIAKQMKGEEHE